MRRFACSDSDWNDDECDPTDVGNQRTREALRIDPVVGTGRSWSSREPSPDLMDVFGGGGVSPIVGDSVSFFGVEPVDPSGATGMSVGSPANGWL